MQAGFICSKLFETDEIVPQNISLENNVQRQPVDFRPAPRLHQEVPLSRCCWLQGCSQPAPHSASSNPLVHQPLEGSAFFPSSPVGWILVPQEFAVPVFILPESGTCICFPFCHLVGCLWLLVRAARLGALVWAGVIPDAKGDNRANPKVQELSCAPILLCWLCYKETIPCGISSAMGSLGQSCLGSRTQTFGGFIFWSWCQYSTFCAQYNIKSTEKWKKPNRKLTLCPNSIYFYIIISKCYFSPMQI